MIITVVVVASAIAAVVIVSLDRPTTSNTTRAVAGPSAASTPTASAPALPSGSGSAAGASGCTAMPITVQAMFALRASKDLSEKGAAEFAGASLRLLGLSPMDSDLPQFQQQATLGAATGQVAQIVARGGNGSETGSISLYAGSYVIASHTAKETVVIVKATPLQDGVAQQNDQGQTRQVALAVTLDATGDGWALANLGEVTPEQRAAVMGATANAYAGTC